MLYENIEKFLKEYENQTIYINFKEYGCLSYNTKTPILEIDNYVVQGYIKENQFIDRELVAKYYGHESSFEDLCTYPYLRIIIKHPEEERLKVLHLNKAYFTSGFQEVELNVGSLNMNVLGAKSWIDR